MSKQTKSSFILLLTAMIWGIAFVAQCSVDGEQLGTFGFNGVRFLLGSISLIPVVMIFERGMPSRKTIWSGMLTGAALFAASAFQMAGISLTHSASKSGFITAMYIIFVPFVNAVIFKKRTHINTWIAAFLALFGLYLLSGGFDRLEFGDILVLVSAIFWTTQIMFIDRFIASGVEPLKFSFMQFVSCAILNLIFAAFTENVTWGGICANAVPILYTGIMSTGVGYTCQVIGQKNANPNIASIIMSAECVFSAIGGVLILHERMNAASVTGCILMFAGIIISQLNFSDKEN